MRPVFYGLLILLQSILISGCADLGYYLHSVKGHWGVVSATRDIDDLLVDPTTTPALKQRLQLVQDIRRFAFNELQLPLSGSYTEYADLGRPYVLKNLFAAPAYSLEARQWCYPIAGCAGYRGFFEHSRLQELVAELQEQHYDIYVANVAAYSTLGWFDDPLLNTFINWPDHVLAGLIFHELAHQRLYVKGDTRFNESFATAVQQEGVERWLMSHGEDNLLSRYRQRQLNRRQVLHLILKARDKLDKVYRSELADGVKAVQKREILDLLKQDYKELSASFAVADGFSYWFDQELNNAYVLAVSTYNDWTPVFRQFIRQGNGQMAEFYQQAEELSNLPVEVRNHCFSGWLQQSPAKRGRISCEGT